MAGRVIGVQGPDPRSFHGRAGRGEWWRLTLLNAVVSAILGLIPGVGPLLAIPWQITMLAVSVRRLHDLGRSGYYLLGINGLWAVAAVVYFIFLDNGEGPPHSNDVAWTIVGVTAVLAVGANLYLGVAADRPGPNAYGEADG